MPLEIGSRLGHYEVTALIGEGGMGQVYRATDTKPNRKGAAGDLLLSGQWWWTPRTRGGIGVDRGNQWTAEADA